MPQRNFLILLMAIAASYVCYVQGAQDPFCKYVAGGLQAIRESALEPVPSRELFDGAMDGMVNILRQRGDEHSRFLGEVAAGELRNEVHQQIGGIGVRIGVEGDPPRLEIVGPPDPGTPAATAKLEPGDHILQIDGQPTGAMRLNDALALIRGEPGTIVRLSIKHAGDAQPHTVELTRSVIQIDSIYGDRRDANGHWQFTLADDPRIAVVRITLFGDRTAAEFASVLKTLKREGVQAIVLDLRDNAGGALGGAVEICEMLLPADQTIVETRGRDEVVRQRYVTNAAGEYSDWPLAVIVNQNSASAAEIVAACLQDHKRAVVVGERSYGKGTVQQLVPLEAGKSLLKLTWASFWRPNGANIHHAVGAPDSATWGVLPDPGFERKLTPNEYAAYEEYRNHRDEDRQRPAASDSKSTDTPENAAADSATGRFVDEPLELAKHYLQGKLSD